MYKIIVMRKNIQRYKCLIYSFVFAALLLISAGCSVDLDETVNYQAIQVSKATTTINFVGHWLNEGQRENFVRNLAREYEFKNQHININLKFPEEIYYDQLDRKSNEKYTAKVIAEGITDWDILRINGEYREVYDILGDPDWAKKNLVDFSQLPEFRNGTLPELLNGSAAADWNGIIPGPLVEGQYWALWCNRNVAKKVGIEVKQFGMTFDDFAAYLRAVKAYNDKNPNDRVKAIFESYVWETTQAIAISLYASLMDSPDEFLSGVITEKRLRAWQQTLEAMESIAPFEPIDPTWRTTEWTETQKDFLDEQYLFYINGSWMYNIWSGIDEQLTMNCMPAEFPGFKPHVVYPAAYQVTWGVPKNAPNRDEAVKFLLAMNQPDIADMWNRYTKCPTGIQGDLAGNSFGGDQFEQFANHVQQNFGTNIYRYYESSAWMLDAAHATTENYFRPVIEGRITAAEAMRRIRQELGRP
jgi:hypothetical protein